jgi:hypothetical protein
MAARSRRRALCLLFSVLALGFGAVAVAAAWGAGTTFGRWIVAVAAAALALWLASLAVAAWRSR